eukprot:679750-Hanusia_phi.AAC.1
MEERGLLVHVQKQLACRRGGPSHTLGGHATRYRIQLSSDRISRNDASCHDGPRANGRGRAGLGP